MNRHREHVGQPLGPGSAPLTRRWRDGFAPLRQAPNGCECCFLPLTGTSSTPTGGPGQRVARTGSRSGLLLNGAPTQPKTGGRWCQ